MRITTEYRVEPNDLLEEVIVAWFDALREIGAGPIEALVRVRLAVRLGQWSYLGAEC